MPLSLADVPEEILERILALLLIQSPEPSVRPSWHPYASSSSSSSSSSASSSRNAPHASVISPLLVCRAWLRIATPIHYRHPVLRTPRHAELLLRALRTTPALARCVRSLAVHATAPALRDLVPLCAHLRALDVTVDNADALPPSSSQARGGENATTGEHDGRVVEFCEAFARTRAVRHLTIRKNAYLTQPNAVYVFEQLAKAIARWPKLETVEVAFRLSPSPAASALVQALAAAPRLHTLHTQLPAVWNTTLLDIAQNPSLARIALTPAAEHAGAHLFLAEARRHPRLVALIRAGAPAPSPSPYSSASQYSSYSPSPYTPAAGQQISFSLAGSARARAASAVMGMGRAPVPVPMPVATWGYEREGPVPACPPSYPARPGAGPASSYAHGPHPVAAPQYAQTPGASPYGHGAYGGSAPQTGRASGPEYAQVPAPLAVVAQGQGQRRAQGSRRMTAA
ncbi:hypothetical protein C2E23DRAFT_935616 [Lenzites betulinus]|nr:hypothetical protein C2E23DRAFT_935616 [Lenzites betulinus]